MSKPIKKPKNGENFSKELDELRSLAISVTNDIRLKIIYDGESPTSWFHYGKNTVCLSLKPYPPYVHLNDRIAKKILDGSLCHELGHYKLGKSLVVYFEKWIERLKQHKRDFPQLASEIVNVNEDVRVDYFMEARYRFDIGKRRTFTKLVMKDVIETNLMKSVKEAIKKYGIKEFEEKKKKAREQKEFPRVGIMWSIYVDEGKWGADCSFLWDLLNKEEKADMHEVLKLLKACRYKRLRIDVVNNMKAVYKIFKKHCKRDFELPPMLQFVPSTDGGKLKGDISPELRKKLEELIKKEIEKEKLEEDLKKGQMAGEGTGDEIPTPEPDINKYAGIVRRNLPEIERLLRKLKKFVSPRMKRTIYQKRGRFMANLVARSYVNSMRRRVERVYIQNTTKFEKEKVNIAFLTDFSGSVDWNTALNITTILTEVFGRYVEDYGFSVAVFAENMQKVKTFFEMYQNTRARIGNISVNTWGTRIHDLLEAYLKMFNSIHEDRRKILCIASDFCFSDEEEAKKVIEQCIKHGIEVKFIGFDEPKMDFADEVKGISRSQINNIHELPEVFLQVYIDIQKG